MTTLQRPVRQAQRRLWLNRLLTALGWTFAIAAGLFIGLVVVDRMWLAVAHPGRLLGWSALGLAVSAGIASLLWSLLTREEFQVAAARLDQAAGLRERLSSGLYCERSQDPFAMAVVADAKKVAAKVTVKHHMPVEVPRSASWAGGGLVAALLFFLLFPAVDLSGKQVIRAQELQREQQVKRTEATMRPIIEDQMKKLGERNPSLKKDLEDLDPLKDAKLQTPADVRTEAIKKVEKLADKLEERKSSKDIAKMEEFQKMMRRLADQQTPANTPVNQLSKSLSQGDFKGAQESLNQIKQQLAQEAKTPQQKEQAEQMQTQLKQLSDKINQIAQDEKKTKDELAQKGLSQQEIQKALEQLKNKDVQALAQKLQEKGLSQQQAQKLVQQLQKRTEATEAAKKLAQKLAQGAQSKKGQQNQQAQQGQKSQQGQQAQQGQKSQQGQQAQQGQPQQAQQGQQDQQGQDGQNQQGEQALAEAGQQLSEMEALQQELNQLQSGLSDLDSLKDQLGEGCPECKGLGQINGKPCGKCQGNGMANPNIGPGMGKLGIGAGGIRQRQDSDAKMVQKHSPVNTKPGQIISLQFVEGEQYKGDVTPAQIEAAIAEKRDVSDAIAREPIPRPIQEPVKKYFQHVADVPAKK